MNKNNFNFFAFLFRMKYINRWGLLRNTVNENLQEHSLQVSIIAHALAIISNKFFDGKVNPDRIAVIAMFHDINETITGDMPTPIKYYNTDIIHAYKQIEDVSRKKLISMLPRQLEEIYKEYIFLDECENMSWNIIKAADKITAYIKCVEECNAGNKIDRYLLFS